MSDISIKELKIIECLIQNSDISQRDISSDIGVSLGLTNILINRLVKKGYLKAKRFNARKIKYFITPRGLKEKTQKTYQFMKRSLTVISNLKDIITDFAVKEYDKGKRNFLIKGAGELSDITELVLKSLKLEGIEIKKMVDISSANGKNTVVFSTISDIRDTVNSSSTNDELNIWREAEKLYGSNYEF